MIRPNTSKKMFTIVYTITNIIFYELGPVIRDKFLISSVPHYLYNLTNKIILLIEVLFYNLILFYKIVYTFYIHKIQFI